MPHFVLRKATISPQSMPASIAAIKHSGMSTPFGSEPKRMPTTAADMEPTTNCPSAPILNTPVLKEKATDSPVIIYGIE